MALVQCIECGANISDKAKTCPKCGCSEPFKKEEVSNCIECLAKIPMNSVSCPNCGYPYPFNNMSSQGASAINQKVEEQPHITFTDTKHNESKESSNFEDKNTVLKEKQILLSQLEKLLDSEKNYKDWADQGIGGEVASTGCGWFFGIAIVGGIISVITQHIMGWPESRIHGIIDSVSPYIIGFVIVIIVITTIVALLEKRNWKREYRKVRQDIENIKERIRILDSYD